MYEIKVYEYEFECGDSIHVIFHRTELLGVKYLLKYKYDMSLNVILGATTRHVMSMYDSHCAITYVDENSFWTMCGKDIFKNIVEDIYVKGNFRLLPMLTNSIDDFFLVLPTVGELKEFGTYTELI